MNEIVSIPTDKLRPNDCNPNVAPVSEADWLPRLATDINREHELAEESARSAVEHAYRAGNFLIQAKHRVKHGEWEQWVSANLKPAASTVRAYMRVAGKLPRLPAQQADHIKTLSLHDAIAYLREPAENPDKPAKYARR